MDPIVTELCCHRRAIFIQFGKRCAHGIAWFIATSIHLSGVGFGHFLIESKALCVSCHADQCTWQPQRLHLQSELQIYEIIHIFRRYKNTHTLFPPNVAQSIRWNEPYRRKYNEKKPTTCLTLSQVQRFGRHILEALLFLRERGIPSHGHLHSGNVILQNGVARYALGLIGFTPLQF